MLAGSVSLLRGNFGVIHSEVCPFPLPAFGRPVDGVEGFRVGAADAPELVERRAQAVERGRRHCPLCLGAVLAPPLRNAYPGDA